MIQNHKTDNLETIVANASASGLGAVSVLRISGAQVPLIVDRFLHLPSGTKKICLSDRVATLVEIRDALNKFLDQAIAILFVAPRSFTGEDLLELHVHGNALLIQEILETVASLEYVRVAQPGEFTKRAYQNQKLDIEQATAIQQIISAQNQLQLKAGRKNLNGFYRQFASELRSQLIQLQAETDAAMDFPEEDLDLSGKNNQINSIKKIIEKIQRLIEISTNTAAQIQGYHICLIGHTNVGKSSLFNELVGNTRAITSAQHGTTRDYICEEAIIGNAKVKFFDTAGLYPRNSLRSSQYSFSHHSSDSSPLSNSDSISIDKKIDKIEQDGIAYTKNLMQQSDLNIFISSVEEFKNLRFPDDSTLYTTKKAEKRPNLYVVNKSDLIQDSSDWSTLFQETMAKLIGLENSPATTDAATTDAATIDAATTSLSPTSQASQPIASLKKWETPFLTSCHQHSGILELKDGIALKLKLDADQQEFILLGDREKIALKKIIIILKKIINLLHMNIPLEIIAVELEKTTDHLTEVTKPITNEEVLGRIFSMFCIGK